MIPWNQAEMKPLEEFMEEGRFFYYMVDHPVEDVRSTNTILSFIPDDDVASYLDMEYFLNRSGRKIASTLVSRISDDENFIYKLAMIVVNRYKSKWEQLFARYSDLETLSLLDNINVTRETTYGKKVNDTGTNTTTKSGTETRTQGGSEQREESFPQDRKTTRELSGGWKDTDTTSTTRTGTQDVTESFPSPRVSSKATTGSYADADTTSTTRTGSTKVTDKGDTATSTWGFNSSTAVRLNKSGPDNSETGITTETSYGEEGLKDQRSGNITRTYNSLTEATTESGSSKLSTTFGENGLKDENAGDVTRLYQNYKDEVKETGTKRLTISFPNGGKTDELSFNNRSDSESISKESQASGKDTHTERGHRYKDYVQQYLAIFSSAQMLDFLEIVFDDVDNVLTLPIFA